MKQANCRSERGFSLMELLLAMALGLVVLAGAVAMLRQGVDISHMVTQRAEMQQNVRVAINFLARDLSIAGTGMPAGGIQLPIGGGAQNPLRGCSTTNCGLWGFFADQRLYSVTPGDGLGPIVNGVQTDIVTLAYRDDSIDLGQLTAATPSGNQLDIDPTINPPLNDPAVGIQINDMLVLCNSNGCAVGVVTGLIPDGILFANPDDLNVNQPSAANGNIASILDPPNGPAIPPTSAYRINTVTYFIQMVAGPDGQLNTADDVARLMRQVNANPPAPVAENIENLQFTYDIFDDNLGVPTAALPNAGGLPNQIRKINISVSARSPARGLFRPRYERSTLVTSVNARNLTFRDRYQ